MIATQEYGWSQHAARAGLSWPQATGWAMQQAASAGFSAWEPLLSSPEDATRVGDLARSHGLTMPSIFLTGTLHEAGGAEAALGRFQKTAAIAARYGCRQAMVYPSALPGQAAKSDPELTLQAAQLTLISHSLRRLGIQLCYHPEEAEMRRAACEFHHMMLATDPSEVALCLDPDTVFRAAGNSNLAVMDSLSLYGNRVAALHLRQMRNGIWSEVLGPGDLDYPAILAALIGVHVKPALIVELAVEDLTPVTLAAQDAHRQSLDYVRQYLVPMLGTT